MPRRIGNVPDHFLVGARPDLLFDFHSNGVQIQAHLLEDVDGDPLAELDQAEQQMFGADKVMIKSVGFLARQCQNLLCARSEVAHRFIAHIYNNLYASSVLSSPGAFEALDWMVGRRTCRNRSRNTPASRAMMTRMKKASCLLILAPVAKPSRTPASRGR